ncbi:hypothetical protein O1611_g6048 [Lasiodiplodia mahajangana]|uniref:Uncharacterized protein n=1 Tax=Lasiodiplodia mahajangana TaxID=1108764 RepID=A0ACC2JJH2_9PEZI|nr:hypothetical protein O1611_g6048 [Lasiodiplodia mahajangana]
MKAVAAGLIALAGIASADVPLYGQCGGINYTGETTCVSGAHCQYMNDYYSQCLAGAGSTTLTTTTKASTTTAATTTKTTTTASVPSSTGFATTSGLNARTRTGSVS